MKTKLPHLLSHFRELDVHPTMYSAQVRDCCHGCLFLAVVITPCAKAGLVRGSACILLRTLAFGYIVRRV